jgi:hypothetical protein
MDAVSDVSQAQRVTIPLILTTIIAVILTLLRLYVRIRMIRLFGWDDFFNVLAMVRALLFMLSAPRSLVDNINRFALM